MVRERKLEEGRNPTLKRYIRERTNKINFFFQRVTLGLKCDKLLIGPRRARNVLEDILFRLTLYLTLAYRRSLTLPVTCEADENISTFV